MTLGYGFVVQDESAQVEKATHILARCEVLFRELIADSRMPYGYGYEHYHWLCNFCKKEFGHKPGCLVGRAEKLLEEIVGAI